MSLRATNSSAAVEPRARGATPRLAGALALIAGLAGSLFAGDSSNSKIRVAAGDGRGLATFGDRALTTFGDRFTESFGRRGLEKFSDIPLTPMGGLIPGGAPASGNGSGSSGRGHSSSSHHHSGFSGPVVPLAAVGSPESEVSVGSNFAFDGASDQPTALLMPRVELPVVVLDHRPALALLEATLDAEIRRADAAGDADLARSLDPDRR